MCHCPNSPWLQRARDFLERNQDNRDGRWFTVNFLVENDHCGIDYRIDIERILNYLQDNQILLDRERFQQEVLGELKRQGIVATLVYPGPQGGVFIPCTEDEVRTVANQILDRVNSEIRNLRGITQETHRGCLFLLLEEIVNRIKDIYNER